VRNLCIGIVGTVGGDNADTRRFRCVAHAATTERLLLEAPLSPKEKSELAVTPRGPAPGS
jgi:hypothetical protein